MENEVEAVNTAGGGCEPSPLSFEDHGVDVQDEVDELVCVRVRGVQVMVNKMGLKGIDDNVLDSLRVARDKQIIDSERAVHNGGIVVKLRGGFKKRVRGLVDVRSKMERAASARRREYLSMIDGKSNGRKKRTAARSTYRKLREGGLPRIEEAQDWFV